jgi:hypothetical protein
VESINLAGGLDWVFQGHYNYFGVNGKFTALANLKIEAEQAWYGTEPLRRA